MFKALLVSFLLFSTFVGFTQAPVGLRHTRSVTYSTDFYVNTTPKKIKYKDTLSYFWFKAQKIHVTQGSSNGYPLHGSYTKSYNSGQIAEKGTFHKGLKNGEWRTWYESGKLKSIYVYKDGLLHGNYNLFDENGTLLEVGKFKNGQKKIKRTKSPKEKSSKKEKNKDNSAEVDEKSADEKVPFFKRIFGEKDADKAEAKNEKKKSEN